MRGFWPAATAAMVEKFDPIRNLDRLGERPCLLLNGAADPLVPTVSNANLVAALQSERCTVHTLSLEENNIGAEGCARLATALRGCQYCYLYQK